MNTAKNSSQYSFKFVEPNFLERDVRFGLNLNYVEKDSSFSSFDSKTMIFQPMLDFPVSENGRVQLSYTAKQGELFERIGVLPEALLGTILRLESRLRRPSVINIVMTLGYRA